MDAAVGTALVSLGTVAGALLREGLRLATSRVGKNGASGDKTVEFWEKTQGEIVARILLPALASQGQTLQAAFREVATSSSRELHDDLLRLTTLMDERMPRLQSVLDAMILSTREAAEVQRSVKEELVRLGEVRRKSRAGAGHR